MALPREQIAVIDEKVDQLQQERSDALIDTDAISKRADGSTFYFPKDPERRKVIETAIEDLKLLQQNFIKDEIDSSAQQELVRDYLREKNITEEEISGIYQSTTEAKVKSFTNSLNKNLAQNLDNFIDVLYTPQEKINQTGAYGPNAEELGITKDPGLFEEFFTWAGSIDPTFTPNGMAERIADNAGAGTADGIIFALPTSRLSTANKIVMDPTKYSGVIGKAKQTAIGTWKGILDIYQDAAAKGNLSAVVLADIMAFAGWEGGDQLAQELVGKGTVDDSQFTAPLLEGLYEYGLPFTGGLAGGTMGYTFWTIPKQTYNMFNNIYKEFFPAVVQRYKDGETLNPYKVWQEARDLKKGATNKVKSAKIIQETLSDENLVEREVAKEIEKEIPGLNLSLAQQTENAKLIEEQKAIENSVSQLSESIPLIAGGDRKEATAKIGQSIKENVIENYKAVDAQVDKQFPKTIFKTNEDGTISEVSDPVGTFFSYVNKDTGAEGSIIRNIADEIIDVEKKLIPGSDDLLPKIDSAILIEQGKQIRGDLISIKDKSLNYYNKELLDIYDASLPNQKLDISEFKDDIITQGALKSFEDPDNLPRQYNEIRDLGQDFENLISNAARRVNEAYTKYIDDGAGSTTGYQKYLDTVEGIEANLKSNIDSLNSKIKKDKAEGKRNTGEQYDPGEIIFNYPEFGSGAGKVGEGFLGRETVSFDQPGVRVTVSYTDPSLNMSAKDMIELKQSIVKDIDLLSTDLFKNSEKIQRLATMNQKIDDVFRNELKDSDDYQKWLKLYEQNYKIPFQEGIINKVLTQTGQGGEYLIGSEVVGKAFLKDVTSINQYFDIFGPAITDGNLSYVSGIKNSFLDDLYSKVLTKDGLIDVNKLKKFEQNNREIIETLSQYIPEVKLIIDDNIKLGVNAANRIKSLKDRERYAGKIDLDELAKSGFKEELSFQDAEALVKQSLKDPIQMDKTVKAILASENSDAMLSAFKNEIFNKWIASSTNRPFKGEMPNVKSMSKWLSDNEEVVKSFYNATGDKGGYEKLLTITKAYDKLNLTGYPVAADNAKASVIKRVFGSDIPQILSRVFAVESGRTSSRFVTAELGMRFFRQMNATKRQKVIAEALYNPALTDTLLKVMTNQPLTKKDINMMKGILGQVQGYMSNTLEDEIFELRQNEANAKNQFENKSTSSLDVEGPSMAPKISKLNIPSPSNASSLAGINMAGNVTQNTIPNTAARGQAVFGQNDPIFGGIGAV